MHTHLRRAPHRETAAVHSQGESSYLNLTILLLWSWMVSLQNCEEKTKQKKKCLLFIPPSLLYLVGAAQSDWDNSFLGLLDSWFPLHHFAKKLNSVGIWGAQLVECSSLNLSWDLRVMSTSPELAPCWTRSLLKTNKQMNKCSSRFIIVPACVNSKGQ